MLYITYLEAVDLCHFQFKVRSLTNGLPDFNYTFVILMESPKLHGKIYSTYSRIPYLLPGINKLQFNF